MAGWPLEVFPLLRVDTVRCVSEPITDLVTEELDNVEYAQRDVERAKAWRAQTVAHARQAGATWALIGVRLGVTKQAAQQRYG